MAKVSLRAYNHEIETMIDRGHLDEAIAHCRHILKNFPKHLETYRLLGKAYLEYKRYPEAADIFSRVLVAVPSDFVANVGMSIIRDEETSLDDAIWYMERAFETQPSNAAIQSELQRLYGRREGIQPPRIRMTRGALAHMYMQGELYPQAISEIKSVLKDDPGRNDMQVLLARAYYRSGLKNDAADVASTVLRTNPYNFDANRVLVEILSVDHPDSVQAYRQRVVELDPYAAQVSSSVFLSNEVPDAAVSLEHLDWNGQPVGLQPDWQATRAISLESNPPQEEQPDWLKSAFSDTSSSGPFDQTSARSVPPFDEAAPSARIAEPAEEIPDFLRAAGWGKSTGAFDESRSTFADQEPASTEPPIEQGELPDWVKAMAPQQPAETPAEEEEELPDWINKIGTSALPVPSEGEQPAAQPAEDVPDWLKQLDTPAQAAAPASKEEPDWLQGFSSQSETTASAASEGESDWLNRLGQEAGTQASSFEASSDEFDFLSKPAEPLDATPASETTDLFGEPGIQPEAAAATPSSDDFDFLNPLGSKSPARASSTEEFDFLSELKDESEQLAPSTPPEPAQAGPLGMSQEEQDDTFAWLEGLAAKQGATEGLLTRPEERSQEEPDWVKQVKGMDTYVEQPPAEQPPVPQPAADRAEPGKSEQDDAFAWLESLAAKQGATEGLLTKPEERREEAPEWVQHAADQSGQTQEVASAQVPEEELPAVAEPSASLEELGTTEQERDDAFAWLESLAAKQGASEGLLTRPEERPGEEPEWVKQAKDVGEPAAIPPASEEFSSMDQTSAWLRSLDEEETTVPQPQVSPEAQPDWMRQEPEQPGPVDEVEAFLQNLEGSATSTEKPLEAEFTSVEPPEAARAEEPSQAPSVAEQPVAADDTAAWLESLAEEEKMHEGSSKDDTAVWLMNLDQLEEAKSRPAEAMQPEELPAWMQDIEEQKPPEEGVPASSEVSAEAVEAAEWMSAIDEEPQQAPQETPKVDTGSLPSWLRGLEEEGERATFGAQEDLPAWLRDETGELLAEPTRIEPTRAADWQPVEAEASRPETVEPEPAAPEPVASQPEPEAVSPETVGPPPQAEPVDVVAIIEEKLAMAEQEPPKTEPPAQPPQEPAVRKVTGTLTDPILGLARHELSRNNVSGALDNYGRLIKKGRFLEEIIYDLREASYRYPVDVNIWQSLGDAYMRANRLQDALDSYTKAEELLR